MVRVFRSGSRVMYLAAGSSVHCCVRSRICHLVNSAQVMCPPYADHIAQSSSLRVELAETLITWWLVTF
jgi:hypothetical protein